MTCELKEHPKIGQCCCICKWQLEAHMQEEFPKTKQFGWACVGLAFMEAMPIAYIDDFEHGLCELFISQPLTEP